jgi:folate-binding protein YgfZ
MRQRWGLPGKGFRLPRLARAVLLREAHIPLAGRLGPVPGGQAVLDYATLDRESPFLQRAALADWGFHATWSVRGAGATKLLHNVLTSDVQGLAADGVQASLLLTNKGKVQGVLLVARHSDDHLDVLCEAGCAHLARPALERYCAVGRSPFEDRGQELGLLLLLGPQAPEVVRSALECDPPRSGKVVETPAGNVLLHAALAGPPGFLLMVRREQAREAWDALLAGARAVGGGPVGWAAVEAARVRAGIPRFGSEGTEDSLPGEAGLDAAITYTKGCFVGQEVVARIRNLGHVNRQCVLLAPHAALQPGDALAAHGQEVGRVTSVALGPGEPAALAVVRREHAQPGTALECGGVKAEVRRLAQLP